MDHSTSALTKQVLVLFPFNPEQKKTLEQTASDYRFHYHDFTDFNPDLPENRKLLDEAEIIIGNVSPKVVGRLEHLKWMQLFSAGANAYTEANTFPEKAVLTNATGAYGLAISEYMLGMTLALQKKLHLYRDNQVQGLWQDEGNISAISGSKTLVIGLGDIGGSFARKMKALGSYTMGVKRHASAKPDYLDALYLSDQLDDCLPQADIIALSLPETDETRQLLDRRRIGLLKPGAIVLNVGRGSAIDTDALCDALEKGGLGGAGLDVTDPEPLPSGHRLWQMRNALITPHVSGGFRLSATQEKISDITINNFKRYLAGKPLHNQVDFKTGYRRFVPGND